MIVKLLTECGQNTRICEAVMDLNGDRKGKS